MPLPATAPPPLQSLTRIGFRARGAVPELKKCLSDDDETVRALALEAIVHAFPSGPEVHAVLAKAVGDSSPRVRLLAGEHLLWVDPMPEILAPVFATAAKHPALAGGVWARFAELGADDCANLLPLALPVNEAATLQLIARHAVELKGQLGPHRAALEKAIERAGTDRRKARPPGGFFVGGQPVVPEAAGASAV